MKLYDEKRRNAEDHFYTLHKELLANVRAITDDLKEKLDELEPMYDKYQLFETHYLDFDLRRIRLNLIDTVDKRVISL